MEERLKTPIQASTTSVPTHARVAGVLAACEEQTAKFNWINLLSAVAAKLGLYEEDATEQIEPVVVRGVTLMIPIVQTLPEDREVVIQVHTGICFLVVWAHHVLGLGVCVRTRMEHSEQPDDTLHEFMFGTSPASVVIGVVDSQTQSSVTLIESANRDKFFSMVAEFDDEPLDTLVRRPAKGIGKFLFKRKWEWIVNYATRESKCQAFVLEMMLVTTALAFRLSKHIYKYDSLRGEPDTFGKILLIKS
jgi:hypothetical protein